MKVMNFYIKTDNLSISQESQYSVEETEFTKLVAKQWLNQI